MAFEACLSLGLDGVIGLVTDSTGYSKRPLGLCLEQKIGLVTLVPRTCAVRRELEAWGQAQPVVPLLVEKPGRRAQDEPRRWPGHRVVHLVEVEYADGRVAQEARRFVVVHSSQLAQQQAQAYAKAQGKEAEGVADSLRRVEARRFACAADAEAAIRDYEGRGQGRRGRRPQPWRSHSLPYRVAAYHDPTKRARRGRPAKAEKRQEDIG